MEHEWVVSALKMFCVFFSIVCILFVGIKKAEGIFDYYDAFVFVIGCFCYALALYLAELQGEKSVRGE